MSKIKVGDFAKVLKNELSKYTAEVEYSIGIMSKDLARSGVLELKRLSKEMFKSQGGNRAYYKGWGMKDQSTKGRARFIIHHRTKPGLPHLLEKGHAKVGGGRVSGKTHIQTVEERIVKEYEEQVKAIIENGGL